MMFGDGMKLCDTRSLDELMFGDGTKLCDTRFLDALMFGDGENLCDTKYLDREGTHPGHLSCMITRCSLPGRND